MTKDTLEAQIKEIDGQISDTKNASETLTQSQNDRKAGACLDVSLS